MKLVRQRGEDPHVYCSVDYSALEMCTLGQVQIWKFGHSVIADTINSKKDIHARLAARIGGTTYDEMRTRVKAQDPWAANLRKLSKPINFGLPGGMGEAKLVMTARKQDVRFCELSGVSTNCAANEKVTRWKDRPISPVCGECLDLAVKYRKVWLDEFDMAPYLRWAADLADSGEPIQCFGNGMLRGGCNYNSAANNFFQNLAAQGAKHAGWSLAKEAYTDRRSVLYGNLRIVVFVHDENMSEIREEFAHECAYRKAKIMVDAMQEFVPDVEITAKPAIARRWFKSMDEVHDKHGRLKPWWPDMVRPGSWTWEPDQELMRADMAA